MMTASFAAENRGFIFINHDIDDVIDSELLRKWHEFPLNYPIRVLGAFRRCDFEGRREGSLLLEAPSALKILMKNKEKEGIYDVCGYEQDLRDDGQLIVKLNPPLNKSSYFNRLEQLLQLTHLGSVYVTFTVDTSRAMVHRATSDGDPRYMCFSFIYLSPNKCFE